jgi:hypothetical protein
LWRGKGRKEREGKKCNEEKRGRRKENKEIVWRNGRKL